MTPSEISALAGALATIVSAVLTVYLNYRHSRDQHGANPGVKS